MSASRYTALLPLAAILGSVTCLGLGTTFAKRTLFPLIGAHGTSAVRIGFAALLLLLFWRPWRWRLARTDLRLIIAYGVALGLMSLCFYLALRTIPFGVAVAIEFSGPLGVALLASRQRLDFVWIGLAVLGLWLLLPLGNGISSLDPVGVLYALAAALCWAAYIVCGQRVGHVPVGMSVTVGMVVAACVVVPIGAAHAGMALLDPWVLGVGVLVALVASAIPMMLEMVALKRVPPQAFGIMISMEPAVAAILALFMLDEQLTADQWLAIALIMLASMGCTYTAQRRRRSQARRLAQAKTRTVATPQTPA